MFTAWEFCEHRATMDIDMLAKTSNSADNLITALQDICELQPDIDDGIIFDSSSVSGKESQANREYSGVQLKFNGELNKARIQMKVDVGFGDVISPSPSLIKYPSILQFPSPMLKGYTAETVIAEKFETIVSRGTDNSRMKDFYDIWTLQRQMDFKGSSLLEAISKTFSNRQTKLDKDSINDLKFLGENEEKGKQWEHFIRKNQFDSQIPNFKNVVVAISLFLAPLVTAANKGANLPNRWDSSKAWSLDKY